MSLWNYRYWLVPYPSISRVFGAKQPLIFFTLLRALKFLTSEKDRTFIPLYKAEESKHTSMFMSMMGIAREKNTNMTLEARG